MVINKLAKRCTCTCIACCKICANHPFPKESKARIRARRAGAGTGTSPPSSPTSNNLLALLAEKRTKQTTLWNPWQGGECFREDAHSHVQLDRDASGRHHCVFLSRCACRAGHCRGVRTLACACLGGHIEPKFNPSVRTTQGFTSFFSAETPCLGQRTKPSRITYRSGLHGKSPMTALHCYSHGWVETVLEWSMGQMLGSQWSTNMLSADIL